MFAAKYALPSPIAPASRSHWTLLAATWAVPLLVLGLTALLGTAFQPLHVERMSPGPVFVLAITVIGAISGLVPALVSAVLASLIFDYFFVEPIYELSIHTVRDLIPPVIFCTCAVVSGSVAGRLKDRTRQLRRTNQRLESLLETSRLLQAAPDLRAIQTIVSQALAASLGVELYLFSQSGEALEPLASRTPDAVSRLARQVAGGSTIASGSTRAYRIDGSKARVGVLIAEGRDLGPADEDLLQALARFVGLAMERAQLASVLTEAQASARAEELKTALLASVSHDLRTPLAAISASASSLIDFGDRFDKRTAGELLQGIVNECGRLNQFTSNLLELSRLQAGGTTIAGQVLEASDVVRAVIRRKKARWPHRDIAFAGSAVPLLVNADTALFDLALTNVIENALHYSEAETRVQVDCLQDGGFCAIVVSDSGRGIPPHLRERVFERFYRIPHGEGAPRGSGLGLAIAKGFVEAFGGGIAIGSPPSGGRGTVVTIRLPLVDEGQA